MHTTTTTTTTIAHRTLARETPGAYEASPPPDAPLDLPPVLAEMLSITSEVDQRIARLVHLLVGVQASGEVEAATELPVEAWLA
ncbi:MAG TPA: hypothetical protein VGA36_10045, partial [Nitriliruptorales bacterium]